jgi:dihydrofolate reductase
MRKVIYSISVSLDGFINDANGSLGWVRVDEEFHSFANEQMRDTGVSVYGADMWRAMSYWDTADQEPGEPEVMYEFARLWKPARKLVFSHSLTNADMRAGAELHRDGLIDTVRQLKSEPGKPIAVSGATIASSLIEAGLIDEIQPFFVPVVIGGGVPFLQAGSKVDFDLLESRTFKSGTVYHRYGKRS